MAKDKLDLIKSVGRATEMFQKWYTLMERDLIIGLIAVFGGGFVLGLIAAAEFFRGIGKGA